MNPETETRPGIASFRELCAYVREDYATNNRSARKWTLGTPGFQAILVYRIGVWCNGLRPALLRVPVRMFYQAASLFVRNVYGIELSATTRVGRRLGIVHQHGIVVHQRAVIGDDCLLRQGCTIGAAGEGGDGTRPPVLGNRVKVGVGAVLAGPITIGDDVNIGPNAVVMTNVASGSIVASPQSRVMTPPPRARTA
jgi:serine O-acetyltransferase